MHVVPLILDKKIKTVITIHDLANFRFPQYYKGAKQKYLTTMTAISARKADRIIAVSENTKKDLIEILHIPESKIAVVHNGLNLQINSIKPETEQNLLRRLGLPENYLLFVGTMEPRKNIEGLMDALIWLWEEKKQKYPLVIVGPKGWLYKNIEQKISTYKKIGTVIQTGYLEDDELQIVYKNSSLFIFPSFYEGFGFPILEAMACGCPVLCNNSSSLPEIGAAAVEYFYLSNIRDLGEKISWLYNDSKKLEQMQKNGKERAKNFSWEKAGAETIQIYQSIIN